MVELMGFLPVEVVEGLRRVDLKGLNEIRLRGDKPVRICLNGRFFYLGKNGVLDRCKLGEAIVCSNGQIGQIVLRATEFSIYAFNNQLCGGYITVVGGIRIGIAGEAVYEGEKIKTIKNFNSLVIRIPHEVVGCADKAYKSILSSKNKNMLIVSPPGCGKTTLLRDLSRLLSNAGSNVLVVDERSEIASCTQGRAGLDVGINTDIICNASKDYAFRFGIRSLRPDYILTDELATSLDIEAVQRASHSGVNVVATVHAKSEEDLRLRAEFEGVLRGRVFGRYVFLKGVGEYDKILDENLCVVV